MAVHPKPLVFNRQFLKWLGSFWGAWNSVELTLSFAIGACLGIPHEQTHILTSGIEFGRKAALLRNLVYQTNMPHKGKIIGLIGKLQNEAKRNAIAHGIIASDEATVTFIEQARGGDYRTTSYQFTLKAFAAHVIMIASIAEQLCIEFQISEDELFRFAAAALRADRKATTSPVPPS